MRCFYLSDFYNEADFVVQMGHLRSFPTIFFLGPRGPLIEPSVPVPSRPVPSVRAKNPDHLYSLIIHHRTTVNLSKEKKGKREKGKRRKREKEKRRKRGKRGKREKEKKGK